MQRRNIQPLPVDLTKTTRSIWNFIACVVMLIVDLQLR